MDLRTRSKGTIVYQRTASETDTNCAGGTTVQSNVGAGFSLGETQTTTDVVVPGFRRRSAAGEIFNNPFRSTKVECSGSNNSSWSITWTGNNPCDPQAPWNKTMAGTWLRSMSTSPGLGCSFNPWTELESRQTATIAGTKAWADIKSPEIQGMVFAAELGKTLRMIKRPLENLARYVRLASVNDKRRVLKWRDSMKKTGAETLYLWQFIMSEWLRYRYGIMPLIYDVEGIMKLANKLEVPVRRTARGEAKFSSGTLTNVIPFGESYFQGQTTTYLKTDVSVRAGVLYEHAASISNRMGYELSQLPSTIYELVPYSFVLDWAVNLGDYIQAMEPKVDVKVLASWTTTKVVEEASAIALASPKTVANHSISGSINATNTRSTTTRIREPKISVGLVNLTKSWDINLARDQKRILDSVALLTGLLTSKLNVTKKGEIKWQSP
jgi:hypothetical protein